MTRDWNSQELTALGAASDKAGGLLESFGQTDLAKLSLEQWHALLGGVVEAFTEKLVELEESDVPF